MTEVVTSLAQWRGLTDQLRMGGSTVGLTMTMGALHAGHRSLFEAAIAQCDAAVATIFVNPLQFNDPADLSAYPADLSADLAVTESARVRAVLVPATVEVWPGWPAPIATSVHVAGVTDRFEGADRPGHFDGVATVVTKLLVATGPCTAYFGEKDYQQLCVVRRVVEDLGLHASIVGCPTVREPDGLALSSRNAKLSERGRAAAACLPRALAAGRDALEHGATINDAEAAMQAVVASEPEVSLAYAAVVEPATLRGPTNAVPGTELRLLIAGVVDGVRLIDNVAAVCGAPR